LQGKLDLGEVEAGVARAREVAFAHRPGELEGLPRHGHARGTAGWCEGVFVAGMHHAGCPAGWQLIDLDAARHFGRPLQDDDGFAVDLPTLGRAVVPHGAVAGDPCRSWQGAGDLGEQTVDGAILRHDTAQARHDRCWDVAYHDVVFGSLRVFEMANASLDGGELGAFGIDPAGEDRLARVEQGAHVGGRRILLQEGADLFQRQAQRAQHHQPVQDAELGGFVEAVAGDGIDPGRHEEADRLVVVQRLDRHAATAGEVADPKHHGRDGSVSPKGRVKASRRGSPAAQSRRFATR
jgi:hypothetical protein